ncbi:MAG: SGNH/GDSL hydrolase family protein [Chloroflexi bacterium]|nr:MAG: SGNH/GDSL hydrolase family protein [Chloroflexota bacterium]MBL1196217.1 SGNH/GDSL hydrolase family protein [Chloroflexota bacterium]
MPYPSIYESLIISGTYIGCRSTYPNVLEGLLNQSLSELPFEVLNFGVSGYSTYDEALVIEHKVLQWQPDLIIVGYVLNDPEIDPVQPIHQHFQATEWWQHSNILRLAFEAKNAWDIERLGDGNYIRYLHAPEERKWSSVLDSFENIARLTNEREIPVLVVIFPRLSLAKTWSDYPFRDLHAQVASAANEQGFFVIDLYDEYSKHPSRDLRASKDNAHPGSFANQLAAQEIYNWLSDHPEMLSIP